MVYGIVGMINFAHGEIYMIGAFISLIFFTLLGMVGITWVPLAIFLVLLLAIFFTAVYGWAVERIAYRPLRGSFSLSPLISAIGMSIFLQNYVQFLQGARLQDSARDGAGRVRLFEIGGFIVQITYHADCDRRIDRRADVHPALTHRQHQARKIAAGMRAGPGNVRHAGNSRQPDNLRSPSSSALRLLR